MPEEVSRGLAMGDVDNDGDLDLLVSGVAVAPRLYKNTADSSGHWLTLRLRNPAWNRDAVGARATLNAGGKSWVAEVSPNVGYLSCQDARIHFGLGEVNSWDSIIVLWPDGVSGAEEFGPGSADQILVLEKGNGRPVNQESADGDSP